MGTIGLKKVLITSQMMDVFFSSEDTESMISSDHS